MNVSAFFLAIAFVFSAWTAAATEKVTLCHAPPDNPTNVRQLSVDARAAAAHLSEHPDDVLGPCLECSSDADCDDGDQCNFDTCSPEGRCEYFAVGCPLTPCLEDAYCIPETGECVNVPKDCGDLVCDEATGECVQQPACPPEQPNLDDPCTGTYTCAYGEECCCGECYPSYICECVEGGLVTCYFTDACFVPPCEIP